MKTKKKVGVTSFGAKFVEKNTKSHPNKLTPDQKGKIIISFDLEIPVELYTDNERLGSFVLFEEENAIATG